MFLRGVRFPIGTDHGRVMVPGKLVYLSSAAGSVANRLALEPILYLISCLQISCSSSSLAGISCRQAGNVSSSEAFGCVTRVTNIAIQGWLIRWKDSVCAGALPVKMCGRFERCHALTASHGLHEKDSSSEREYFRKNPC